MKQALATTALALCLAATGWQAWRWHQARITGAALAELAAGHDLGAERRMGASFPVRLGHALWMAGHGYEDEAKQAFGELGEAGETENAGSARAWYDLGNLHLRQALLRVEQAERALPLAELAKTAYRRALRLEPAFWDAKFNLETATRLAPDFDRMDSGGEPPDPETARKLWTQVPGFPRGLP